ncbi:peroxiredoxin [Stetteria hydrogenophila]
MEAPDFELPAHDGSTVRLSSLRGRVVVLYFYPRAMTPGCTRETARFNELLGEFEKLGAAVLGVSTDPVDRNARFASKLGVKFKLLSDVNGEVAGKYGVLREGRGGVRAERVTFIIDGNGVIREVIRGVRPAEKHADLALEAVKKLAG